MQRWVFYGRRGEPIPRATNLEVFLFEPGGFIAWHPIQGGENGFDMRHLKRARVLSMAGSVHNDAHSIYRRRNELALL